MDERLLSSSQYIPMDHFDDESQLSSVPQRWRHQKIDEFLKRAYKYYLRKGFWNIVFENLFDHLKLIVITLILLFLFTCVNLDDMKRRLDYAACVNGTTNSYTLFEVDCHGFQPFRLQNLENPPPGVIFLLVMVGLIFLFRLLRFLYYLPSYYEMKQFYNTALFISESELQTIEWYQVVDKLQIAQRRERMCITVKDLSPLDITNLIMRRENYFIALYNLNILDLKNSTPLSGSSPFLPLYLQHALEKCISDIVFDTRSSKVKVKHEDGAPSSSSTSRNEAMLVATQLGRYMRLIGLFYLVGAPFVFFYRLIGFLFEHSMDFKGEPGSFFARQWTPYAKWKLREFNEMADSLERRLNRSFVPSNDFINMFTSRTATIVASFGNFVLGGLLMLLVAIGIISDEAYFVADLFGDRSVAWFIGILVTGIALFRGLIPNEHHVYEPVSQMKKVVEHTHYFPQSWHHRETTAEVLGEFTSLFRFKIAVFVEELLAIVIVPYMLLFRLPQNSSKIVEFFASHTVSKEGLGDVCSFADFRGVIRVKPVEGDLVAASLVSSTLSQPVGESFIDMFSSNDRKLEHSILTFKKNHPTWEPDARSKEYLKLQEEKMASSHADSMHSSICFEDDVEEGAKKGRINDL